MYTITLENGMRFYLRPLKKEEIEEASFLSDECVGKNLYPKEEIAATLNDQEKFFYLLKNEKDETIGYIYYFLTNEEEIAKYSKLDINVFREVYSNFDKKVGKIQSVGIKREYRGNELAVEMMQFILKEMKKANIDITFIVCWKPGGILPLGKTLAKCQFDYLTEAKKIWYDDMELICPHCKGRCSCDAEIYYKLL